MNKPIECPMCRCLDFYVLHSSSVSVASVAGGVVTIRREGCKSARLRCAECGVVFDVAAREGVVHYEVVTDD